MCIWYRHILFCEPLAFFIGERQRKERSDGCGVWSIVYWWCFTCCRLHSRPHLEAKRLCWLSNLIFAAAKPQQRQSLPTVQSHVSKVITSWWWSSIFLMQYSFERRQQDTKGGRHDLCSLRFCLEHNSSPIAGPKACNYVSFSQIENFSCDLWIAATLIYKFKHDYCQRWPGLREQVLQIN